MTDGSRQARGRVVEMVTTSPIGFQGQPPGSWRRFECRLSFQSGTISHMRKLWVKGPVVGKGAQVKRLPLTP